MNTYYIENVYGGSWGYVALLCKAKDIKEALKKFKEYTKEGNYDPEEVVLGNINKLENNEIIRLEYIE